jgi:glycine oxidase
VLGKLKIRRCHGTVELLQVLDRTMSKQVVIVGGGVIGLLTAFNLAAEVDRVVLCDQGEVGRESSWAGAVSSRRCTRGATARR